MKQTFHHTLADIRYEVVGSGFPILFLHGYELDHRSLKHSFEPLCKHQKFMRIYPDLPGMGKSIAKPGLKNADDMIAVLADFVQSAIPNQKFAVVGLSYGGYLARWFTNNQPELVTNAMLICPVIDADPSKRKLPKFRVAFKDVEFIQSLNADEYEGIRDWMPIQTKTVYDHFLADIACSSEMGQKDFLEDYAKNGYGFSDNFDYIKKYVETPAVFIVGREDIVVGYSDAVKLAERFINSDVHIIAGAGHFLQRDQQQIFDAIVLAFLQRL